MKTDQDVPRGLPELADIIDVPAIQRMMDDFYGLTGVGVGIVDLKGTILVATGWQEICTRFHRVHPETLRHCIESDVILSSGVAPGSFRIYRCKNNLCDIATPIMLGGHHAGNLFLGQFLYEGEEPDRELFRAQARQYGFDQAAYLAALDRLPRWSRDRVQQAMSFYAAFAQQISHLSSGSITLARTLIQQDELLGRLRENEERLRLALKATNDVVWDWDIVRDAQRWNESGTAVFGWTDIVEAPQTAAWWVERVHPEDRQRVDESFFAAVHDPTTDRWGAEYRFRKSDGTYAHVVDRGHILRDGAGRAVRMIGAMLDITARTRAQEALRASEAQLSNALKMARAGHWEYDVATDTFTFNDSFYRIFRTTAAEVGGYTMSSADYARRFCHPEDAPFVAKETRAAVEAPDPLYSRQLEHRILFANGDAGHIAVRFFVVKDAHGRTVTTYGVNQDITERKRAEDELRRSRQLLDATEALSGIGGWEWDIASQTMAWTQGTYRIHDFTLDEVPPGSPDHIARSLACYDPADRARLVEAFQRCTERGEAYDLECGFTTAAGRRLRVRTMGRPVQQDGRTVRVLGNIHDITEQRRAQDELRGSTETIQALLNATDDLVFLMEPEGTILAHNHEAAHRLGHPGADLVGTNIYELLPPAVAAYRQEWVATVVRTGQPLRVEDRHARAGIVLDSTVVPLFDEAQRVNRIAVFSRDITEQKKAEQSLRDSEARFAALFRSSPMAAAITAVHDGRLVDVNAAFEKLTGRVRADCVGHSVLDLGLWADPEERAEMMRLTRDEGAIHGFECSLRHISGEILPILISAEFVRIGEAELLLTMALDISRRKHVEDALQRERDRLQFVVDGARLGTWVWNVQTNETVFNETWAAMCGYSLSELTPTHFETWTRMVHPEDFPSTVEELRQCLTGATTDYECEFRMQHRDGHWVWILDRGRIMTYDTSGAPLSMFGTHLDITERKHAEEDRERLQAQLLQAQKMESVGRLAGGVAHDFNNMLGIILGYGEMLLEQLHPGDPLTADVREIVDAARRSSDLTRQLLAFARKQKLQPEALLLNDIVRKFDKMLRRIIGEDIELILTLAEETGPVLVDRGQIEQVITNLAVNARDAMPSGGKLIIQTGSLELNETCAEIYPGARPGRYATLTMTDSGCGMDQQVLSQIFEPFFTTKEMGSGTGLGLSTVYGIVQQSNGSIWASSEPGQGTTFRICLPETRAVPAPATEGAREPAAEGAGQRILVVEDETSLRKLLEASLVRLGYKVAVAANSGEALLILEEKGFEAHLVLTDVVMPNMSGIDLAERLKKSRPDLKVLFMSGYTDNVLIHHWVVDQKAPFIQKPFTIRELARMLKEALQ